MAKRDHRTGGKKHTHREGGTLPPRQRKGAPSPARSRSDSVDRSKKKINYRDKKSESVDRSKKNVNYRDKKSESVDRSKKNVNYRDKKSDSVDRSKKNVTYRDKKSDSVDRSKKKINYRDKKSDSVDRSKKKINYRDKNSRHSRCNKNPDDSDFEEIQQAEVNQAGLLQDFPSRDADSDTEQLDTRKLVQQQNRKKKKSGGFQAMGLSSAVWIGIERKGYKIPTPIQRKTIPLIMDGKDVVAMARTGSGKTAAFLIPMFEQLKSHMTAGARALVLAPTRELALQTLKFTKELGKYTGLKFAVILGGDTMEDQFAALHENPDVIIATPGRFVHVCIEMDLKLSSVQYIVFDEADRLFEMGFQEQLQEVLQRLPEERQTVLFSATLPKLLVEFAKAGLHDPTLIRLDVDSKLSENLRMAFLKVRSEDKTSVLLHLLRNVIKPSEQTVVFTATKHHVEYLNMVLSEAGLQCSYSYSALDQTARKINVAKFRSKKTMVLLVTDLAARGIDIPLLDNVINYNFPAQPKLFVHRVGRVARAGQSGTAYSMVGVDELPYMLDLHLFVGRPVTSALHGLAQQDGGCLYGRVPQSVIDAEEENLRVWQTKTDVFNMEKVISNAYKNYVRSRPAPSHESVKRAKQMDDSKLGFHPVFGDTAEDAGSDRSAFLNSMRNYKPKGTIFEINSTHRNDSMRVMQKKRQMHQAVVNRVHLHKAGTEAEARCEPCNQADEVASDTEIEKAFSRVIAPKPSSEPWQSGKKKPVKRKADVGKDEENYLNYRPKDFQSEKGLSLGSSFERDAGTATMDMAGDDSIQTRRMNKVLKWDRKRKKYVQDTGEELKSKKIRTESGAIVKATFKSNIYRDWLEKSKVQQRPTEDDDDDDEHGADDKGRSQGKKNGKWKSRNAHKRGGAPEESTGHGGGGPSTGRRRSGSGPGPGAEPPAMRKRFLGVGGAKGGSLKRKEQVLKERRKKDKLAAFMKHRESKRGKTTGHQDSGSKKGKANKPPGGGGGGRRR